MAPISLIDQMTLEEQALLSFYKMFPGIDWVQAAEALNMDEDEAFNLSVRLQMRWGEVRMEWNAVNLATFVPRRFKIRDQQIPGTSTHAHGAETLETRRFELSQV